MLRRDLCYLKLPWSRWRRRCLQTSSCRRTFWPPHGACSKTAFLSSTGSPEFFSNTGIVKRHGVKPFEWYLEPRGWPERTAAFLEGAEALFVDVAEKALADAQLTAGDIDTVVTVCSTGIATPSLEARVAGRMGFRSDVMRVPVFGLGCAGGTSGLSIAARLAQARPGTNVLLVTLELCSLALRHDELTKANIVAVSLFGDGAAAVVLRAGDGGATQIEHVGEHIGRTRWASWAGALIPKASELSSAAPSQISCSPISIPPWCRFSALCS